MENTRASLILVASAPDVTACGAPPHDRAAPAAGASPEAPSAGPSGDAPTRGVRTSGVPTPGAPTGRTTQSRDQPCVTGSAGRPARSPDRPAPCEHVGPATRFLNPYAGSPALSGCADLQLPGWGADLSPP
jgi:hypothetical protein